MGDASDNVPGVPGIGEKGARQLIAEYGSLDALLERAGEVSRKAYREGLQQHREQALLSRELVTIHTDLPIELEPDKLVRDEPDWDKLLELCWRLEFHVVARELEAGRPEKASVLPAAVDLASAEEWRERVAGLSGEIALGLVGDARSGLLDSGGPRARRAGGGRGIRGRRDRDRLRRFPPRRPARGGGRKPARLDRRRQGLPGRPRPQGGPCACSARGRSFPAAFSTP